MRFILQCAVVFFVAFLFPGCELGKEERARLNVELQELRERRTGALFSCKLVHQNEYQVWREDNADRIPTDDYMAKAMCFAEAADEGWVKAWKATEEQVFEMDARIKTIESLLGEPESNEQENAAER